MLLGLLLQLLLEEGALVARNLRLAGVLADGVGEGATDEETGEAVTTGYGEREYQRENAHGIAHQGFALQLIRESIDAERLRRRSAAQGLRERIKTEAGRETKRIKDELKHASADRAVEELHAAYDEAVAAREGAVAAAGTEGA